MDNCLFCEIAKGVATAFFIAEDNNHLAFLDIHPLAEGHTLVVPKKHYKTVWDMPPREMEALTEFARYIARHYQDVTRNDLVYMLVLGGKVPHAAMHIIPNYDNTFQYAINECITRNAKTDPINIDDAYYVANKYRLRS